MIDQDLILSALSMGTMRLEGQFIYGSNHTFMVDCRHKGLAIKAVYKPLRGEHPLWDFPHQTLARREVAAHLVSDALGWDLVPPTVFRSLETLIGPGSAQLFIEHNPEKHYFTFTKKEKTNLPRVMLFDLLINNADRKAGHLLIDAQERLWLIDHGLSFHQEDKLRTVIWDHAGERIPDRLLTDLENILPDLVPEGALQRALQPHLLPQEIEALRSRARNLLSSGVFPHPPEDRRAYPWPLI